MKYFKIPNASSNQMQSKRYKHKSWQNSNEKNRRSNVQNLRRSFEIHVFSKKTNQSEWKKPLPTHYTFHRFNKTLIKATRANFQSMISANFKRRHRCAGIFHIFLLRTGRIFFPADFFPYFRFFFFDFFAPHQTGVPFINCSRLFGALVATHFHAQRSWFMAFHIFHLIIWTYEYFRTHEKFIHIAEKLNNRSRWVFRLCLLFGRRFLSVKIFGLYFISFDFFYSVLKLIWKFCNIKNEVDNTSNLGLC